MNRYVNFLLSLLCCLILTQTLSISEEIPAPTLLESSEGKLVDMTPSEKGIVVYEWFNPECPFVKKIYKNSYMPKLQEDYISKGVKWYVINSTNKGHRDFVSKEKRAELKSTMGIKNATMLYDGDGEFGKATGAKTTPHIFVYSDQKLVYSGAFDDSPETESDPEKAEKQYLKITLDALLSGSPIEQEKTRPYGCSVKY